MAFTATTSTQEMLHTLAAKTHLTKGAMKLYVRERGQGEQINSPDIVMLTAADRSPFTTLRSTTIAFGEASQHSAATSNAGRIQ